MCKKIYSVSYIRGSYLWRVTKGLVVFRPIDLKTCVKSRRIRGQSWLAKSSNTEILTRSIHAQSGSLLSVYNIFITICTLSTIFIAGKLIIG